MDTRNLAGEGLLASISQPKWHVGFFSKRYGGQRSKGRGGGLVVSVLAFYSDTLSSNPADCLNNFLYKKTKINEKEARVDPSLNKMGVAS